MYLTSRNQNWLPEVFNTLFDTDMFPMMRNTTSPAINVIEKDTEYDVELAAPGARPMRETTRPATRRSARDAICAASSATPSSIRPCCCPTT